ncbi:MAG TPA: Holliday junction resolvase RuvX [Xanthomonadales bacterium]
MPDEAARPAGTIIAFDFGLRRIGVAVGQTVTSSASALSVVPFADRPDWQAISSILKEWKPTALVVGLPLAEDGGETDMSESARRFGRQLEGRYAIPVYFEDERLTSFSAEQRFVDSRSHGGMRRKDASLKDAIAAQIILENWLQK